MKVCEPPVLLSLLVIGLSLDTVDSGEAERRLLNTLMEQYNKLERPVYNESDPLVLTFGLTLQQIIDVVSFIFPNYTRYTVNSAVGSCQEHFL